MATPIEQTAIWILEALREERRREPDFHKCKLEGELLTPVRDKHGLCDADISEALVFLCRQRYADIIKMPSGRVVHILNLGIEYLDARKAAEAEERKWKRSEKIALASFILSVVSFFAGIHVGERASKKQDTKQTPPPPTNSAAATVPKQP
jgi:hypothetical protein